MELHKSAAAGRPYAEINRAPVPTYKLFGENELWQSPDLVHCETIAERSALHGWEITPHRHDNLIQVLFLRSGTASMTIETTTARIETPCVIFIPPHQIHGFCWSHDVVGYIVSLPHTLLGELLALAPALHSELKAFRLYPLKSEAGKFAALDALFARFIDEYANDNPGRPSMLMAHLTQLAVWLARFEKTLPDAEESPDDRRHVDRFQQLIDQHFAEWKPLSFYDDRLGVSPRQLNTHCRRVAGRSAQTLIHDRLILEARRLIAYSDQSVTSISYALGFSEPAYFSRFFVRAQGLTPSEFRQNVRSNKGIQLAQ